MARRLLFGTASSAVSRIASLGTVFFLTPFLLRALGTEAYGLVMLLNVLTFNGYGSLADLGIASAVVKYTAEYRAQGAHELLRRLLDTSFALYWAISVAGGVLVLAVGWPLVDHVFRIAPALVPLAHTLLLVLAVTTTADFASAWCSAVLEGHQQFSVANGVQLGRTLVGAALTVLLVSMGRGALGWLEATAITSLLVVATLVYLVARLTVWRPGRLRLDRETLRRVAAFSARIFSLRITGVMYNNVDRTVLGVMLPTSSLAVYDVANKVHTVGLMPMGFTSSLVVPAASGLQGAGRDADLRELFLRGTLYTVALSLPVTVLLFATAPEFLRVWLGPDFVRYAFEVRLFLSYLVFWVLPQVGWNMLVGLGQASALLRINVLSVTVNVVCSVLLARSWGIAGVIAGTVIGNLLATPLYLRLAFGRFGSGPAEFARRVLLRSYPQAAVAGLAVWGLIHAAPPHGVAPLLLYLALGMGVFGALFWRGVDDVDRARLRRALGRPWAAASPS